MFPESFDSRAKGLPAKKNKKGCGEENVIKETYAEMTAWWASVHDTISCR